eukprot:TRINITY_DN679_c0_g1_i12.p1 TRINITY_DN679_c0_g1~~TRINITY_DN679_c0_g1_i12.p1  ORF type:complete len:249 (-),score=34.64 TRINITY_DN679_c0_g1_i12:94-840(-)
MSGSYYDISSMTYSPDGRVFQVEYSQKVIENSETVIGVKCKDGIVLGSEKLLHSTLQVENTHKRIFTVDKHIGMVVTGKIPDGVHIVNRARSESKEYTETFGVPISGKILADRLGQFVHVNTLYYFYRPYGSAGIIGSYDASGPSLFMYESNGVCVGYHACAIGKGKQTARSELEKRDFKSMTCREALQQIAKIINLCHEEFKEKRFEVELSWICAETNYQHQLVPLQLRDEVDKKAKDEIEREQMGE